MGIAVFSGMLGVTVFGLVLTPVFYVVSAAGRMAHAATSAPLSTAGRIAAPAEEL